MDFDINAYLRLNPMDMIMVCVSTLIIIAIAKHFSGTRCLPISMHARLLFRQISMQVRKAGKQENNTSASMKSRY